MHMQAKSRPEAIACSRSTCGRAALRIHQCAAVETACAERTLREYEELPELDDEMLARAVVNKGGRPVTTNPRTLVSIRLPADTLARWKATGPGWQTRMAETLANKTL